MVIGSRQRLRHIREMNSSLNGQLVDNVSTFKYLGMIIDSHLSFDKHVDFIVEKSTNKLGMLYKTRWLFNLATAKMLYNALILPHFDFGNTVYTVASQQHLNRLQVVQNVAARLIPLADSWCSVYDLHERLGWDTLATRAEKAFVRIIFSVQHFQAPSILYDSLDPLIHGRVTRATESGMMDVPRTNTDLGKSGFRY